jgi:hypothetical protein
MVLLMNEQVQVMFDPQLTWVAIQDAALGSRSAELADIAFALYGQLGEARAEITTLRAALRRSLASRRYGSQPASYAARTASTRLRAFSLATMAVR